MSELEEIKNLLLELKKEFVNIKKSKITTCDYTFYDWIDKWYEVYKRPKLTPGALINLERNIRLYIKPLIQNKNLAEVTSIDVQECLNSIKQSYTKKYTFNNLNNLFRFAKRNKIIQENIMEFVDPTRHNYKIGQSMTLKQQREFLKSIEGFKYKNLFKFYLLTGARRSEALLIKWTDIDYQQGTIFIKGTKSVCAERRVPLFKQTRELLKDIPKINEYIFPIKLNSLICSFKRLQKKLSFNLRLHELRHTFATRCLESGISLKVVQHWLGHSNMSLTANIYSHVQTKFEQSEVKKFDPKF